MRANAAAPGIFANASLSAVHAKTARCLRILLHLLSASAVRANSAAPAIRAAVPPLAVLTRARHLKE